MAQYAFDFKALRFQQKDPGRYAVPAGLRAWTIPSATYWISRGSDAEGMVVAQGNLAGGNYSSLGCLGVEDPSVDPPGAFVAAADVEFLVKFKQQYYAGGGYNNDGIAFIVRSRNDGADCYEIAVNGSLAGTGSNFRRRVADVTTDDTAKGYGFARITDNWYWVRFSLIGSTFSFRSWADGSPEPTGSPITWTDSTHTIPGSFGFGIRAAGNTNKYSFGYVGIGTDGDPAPAPAGRSVSGVLRTPSGELALGYLVRCYDRTSGSLIGETLTNSSTGAFSFNVDSYAQVYVMGVDRMGFAWRANGMDLITPA